MEKDSHVRIFLDSIEVHLHIGIYPHEQDAPQRVVVDVALYADLGYLKTVTAETIIDYGVIRGAITAWAERSQVLLIEDYLKELVDLSFAHEQVIACRLAIKKADIFGEDQGAGAEVFMRRADWNVD